MEGHPLQLRVLNLENTLLSSPQGSDQSTLGAQLETTREDLISKMKTTISHNHFTRGGRESGWKMMAEEGGLNPGWIKLNLGGGIREN